LEVWWQILSTKTERDKIIVASNSFQGTVISVKETVQIRICNPPRASLYVRHSDDHRSCIYPLSPMTYIPLSMPGTVNFPPHWHPVWWRRGESVLSYLRNTHCQGGYPWISSPEVYLLHLPSTLFRSPSGDTVPEGSSPCTKCSGCRRPRKFFTAYLSRPHLSPLLS
jgi:hypothetical protein